MKFLIQLLFLGTLLGCAAAPAESDVAPEPTPVAAEEEIDTRHAAINERGQRECDFCAWKDWFKSNRKSKPKSKPQPKPVYYRQAFTSYPNDGNPIGLQNLDNRALVYCYDNAENTAESCAQYFERNGYVRLRDIPYKTANYDFLKVDTYPTRRWRDNEVTSRW